MNDSGALYRRHAYGPSSGRPAAAGGSDRRRRHAGDRAVGLLGLNGSTYASIENGDAGVPADQSSCSRES